MKYLQGIEPREYQKRIFESCKEENCLVVLPTGLGKTLIALMLSIHRMEKYPGKKIVFLAPTKPLAEQHLKTFEKFLPELFADMQLFTGKVKAEQRKKIWKTADIIFSTPQCIANDLKKMNYDLNEVSLLVEDEAHRCIKNYDYNFIAKKYISQSTNPLILGMTASPGSEKTKIKEICKNLAIKKVELRTRESSDVKKYLQELEFEKIKLDFPAEFEELRQTIKKLFDGYVESLKKRNVLFKPATKTNLIMLQKEISSSISRGNKNFGYFHAASECAQAIKLQHAQELLETQTISGFNKYLKQLFNDASKGKSKGIQKLVSKTEFNYIFMKSNELIAKKIEHPKIEKLVEIIKQEKQNPKVIVFTQFRDTASIISKKLNELENIKSKVFVGQTKKTSSSGEETTGLSQKEQKQVIDEFSRGEINVLTATSIAEEGLDIPEVNAVIFYEPIPSAIRSIQRKGRTARLMKGKLIMLITKQTRDENIYYVSRSREKKMQSVIEEVSRDLGKINYNEKQEKL